MTRKTGSGRSISIFSKQQCTYGEYTKTDLHLLENCNISHYHSDHVMPSQPAALQLAARDQLKISIIRRVLCHQETTELPHHSHTETQQRLM